MYSSPFSPASELGDHDVFAHADRLHLLHIPTPGASTICHAMSEDGLSFRPASALGHAGDPGACDDAAISAPAMIRNPDNGQLHLYYTAKSLADGGNVERIGLLVGESMDKLVKYPKNPVAVAEAPYYNDDADLLGRVAFRDPYVFIEDDIWHMLVCVSAATGDRLRRGCIAHLTSQDGMVWESEETIYSPCQFDDMEAPAVIRFGNRYYLFFREAGSRTPLYRVAESLNGPWLAPMADELLPADNTRYRFCEWQGETLLFTSFSGAIDWPSEHETCTALLPPKTVRPMEDGTLRLGSYGGWSAYHQGGSRELRASAFTSFSEGAAGWHLGDDRISADVAGQIVGASHPEYDDFILDMELGLEGGRALGLIFRASDDLEDGNWLRLDFARQRVELHHYTAAEQGLGHVRRKQPTLKQAFDTALNKRETLRLHLIASREYIEVSINEKVVISTVTYAQTTGVIGVFIENGEGWFGDARVQPIVPPVDVE